MDVRATVVINIPLSTLPVVLTAEGSFSVLMMFYNSGSTYYESSIALPSMYVRAVIIRLEGSR